MSNIEEREIDPSSVVPIEVKVLLSDSAEDLERQVKVLLDKGYKTFTEVYCFTSGNKGAPDFYEYLLSLHEDESILQKYKEGNIIYCQNLTAP